MLDFTNEVALVTGAGQGLGRAYALALARRGAHVIVNDTGEAAHAIAALVEEADGRATAAVGSVFEDADAIVETALAAGGRLDIVINNAGISGGGPFHKIPRADWDRLFEVQLGGTVNISRAAWPHLAASGKGRLLNTSSSSTFGAAFTSHYAAAKAAIFCFTRSWAGEGAGDGIRVNCIMPSAFTPMSAQIPDPDFRNLLAEHFPPEPVAEFVTWLVHRDTALSGETFEVGGGRAGRIVMAEAPGVFRPGGSAEHWQGQEAALLSLEGMGTPGSMIEEVAFQVQNMDADIRAAFAAVDQACNWAG
ncbi:SDR family NAD(P)-dependent oxidoreductase [Sphingobium aromaticivastans]|uniref:SDR family NAD(P)-dependent oxidoreductase n=1 Tax=Sphingobium aromaticivastans TaxID=1778665 RepID=UPI00301A0F5D